MQRRSRLSSHEQRARGQDCPNQRSHEAVALPLCSHAYVCKRQRSPRVLTVGPNGAHTNECPVLEAGLHDRSWRASRTRFFFFFSFFLPPLRKAGSPVPPVATLFAPPRDTFAAAVWSALLRRSDRRKFARATRQDPWRLFGAEQERRSFGHYLLVAGQDVLHSAIRQARSLTQIAERATILTLHATCTFARI